MASMVSSSSYTLKTWLPVVLLTPRHQVGRGRKKQVRVVVEESQRLVALHAQESTNLTGDVVMVDMPVTAPAGFIHATESADSGLSFEHLLEPFDGDAVGTKQMSVSPHSTSLWRLITLSVMCKTATGFS